MNSCSTSPRSPSWNTAIGSQSECQRIRFDSASILCSPLSFGDHLLNFSQGILTSPLLGSAKALSLLKYLLVVDGEAAVRSLSLQLNVSTQFLYTFSVCSSSGFLAPLGVDYDIDYYSMGEGRWIREQSRRPSTNVSSVSTCLPRASRLSSRGNFAKLLFLALSSAQLRPSIVAPYPTQ